MSFRKKGKLNQAKIERKEGVNDDVVYSHCIGLNGNYVMRCILNGLMVEQTKTNQ